MRKESRKVKISKVLDRIGMHPLAVSVRSWGQRRSIDFQRGEDAIVASDNDYVWYHRKGRFGRTIETKVPWYGM